MSVDHYENFPVASVLCPAALRPAVVAIYMFARTADDLADEGDASAQQRLDDLRAYRADLQAIIDGGSPSSRWPGVFTALQRTMLAFDLPPQSLTDLLSAFEQDVVKHRYSDRAELLDYCRRSANPIGRLMLHLYRVAGTQAQRQSDAICTALQLANFWQDVSIDTHRGRLYIPETDCRRHGVASEQFAGGQEDTNTRAVLAEMVRWTRELMSHGAPLVHRLPGRSGWELRLVVQGGLRILDKIERMDYGTLHARPRLNGYDAPRLFWRALRMRKGSDSVATEAA